MEKVKSAYEKAMEKIQKIEDPSPAEKEAFRQQEQIQAALAAFFRGALSGEQLREKLRGIHAGFLREAQTGIAGSLRLGNSQDEFARRREGILAIETLKSEQNFPAIDELLKAMEMVRKEDLDVRKRAAEELRRAVEENPQLRARPVRTPDGRTVTQAALSVDEAVQTRMAEFLDGHEKRYDAMFSSALQRLLRELQ